MRIIERIDGGAIVEIAGKHVWVPDPDGGATWFPGGLAFRSHLWATHRDPMGRVIGEHDCGSGLVTNVGVLAMANDFAWSSQLNLATLALANNHGWGTNNTAAAATDLQLTAIAAPSSSAYTVGTQTLVSGANSQKYQSVATIAASGTLTIVEWGLFTSTVVSSTTGSPFTAASATSWTDTGSAQTASSATVRGLQQFICLPGTTAVWGLCTSNTTHVAQVPAWYKVADGTAGSTPGNTETFTIRPVMWDHKVFTGIVVNNLDTITFTYQLTVSSGG